MSEVKVFGDGPGRGASGVVSSDAVVPSAGGGFARVALVLQPHLLLAGVLCSSLVSRSYQAPLEQRHTGHSHYCPTDFRQKYQEVVVLAGVSRVCDGY